VHFLRALWPLLNRHEVRRPPSHVAFASVSVVELRALYCVPKPLITKRLERVERQPLVEQIDRHALGQVVDVPHTQSQRQPKQKSPDRLAF